MTITFSSTQTITALTVSANTGQSIVGAPASLGANSAGVFVYRLANTTWYPISGSSVLTNATLNSPTINTPTMGGTVITSGTVKNSTSGTTVDFTGIPSWVKRITVMLNGVSTSGTSPYIVQLGYSGGFGGATYNSSGSGATSGVSSVTTTVGLYIVQAPGGGGSGAAGLFNGAMTLTNFSGNTWVSTAIVAQNSVAFTNWAAGIATAGGVLTQVRITTVNGTDTFDAGSINIFYE
jgi:hypothetical protein